MSGQSPYHHGFAYTMKLAGLFRDDPEEIALVINDRNWDMQKGLMMGNMAAGLFLDQRQREMLRRAQFGIGSAVGTALSANDYGIPTAAAGTVGGQAAGYAVEAAGEALSDRLTNRLMKSQLPGRGALSFGLGVAPMFAGAVADNAGTHVGTYLAERAQGYV